MLKDFVSNAALLIASFSFMGQIFNNKPLQNTSPLVTKLYWGFCYGVLGNILMIFSIQINPIAIADFRHLAIVIPAAFGGFVPAMVSAILIATGRFFILGISHLSIVPSLGMLIIGIVCGLISKVNIHSTLKAFFMNLSSLIIISFVFFLILDNSVALKNILIVHFPISLIGGFIAYHFSMFIANSNESQRQLKISHIKLKETEERFRLLAEYSSDMITMHNEESEYKYISPAVKEIIKFEYPELLGKKIENFIHPDDILRTNEIFNKALQEGYADSTYRYRTKQGDYVWIESTLKSVYFQEENSRRVIIVSRNITERKLTEEKLHKANELLNRLSYMDGLTGVANRRYFDETLEREWTKATNEHSPLTLIMFDLDYFKKYNDTYGHLAGDSCLQAIAKTIKQIVSKNTSFTFCRYGGEEFAIILPSTKLQNGMSLANSIQQSIQLLKIPHLSSEVSDIVTLSIGIAKMFPNSRNTPKDLINRADTALYNSKANGRNTITVYKKQKAQAPV